MIRRPPRSTCTYTHLHHTTLFRSHLTWAHSVSILQAHLRKVTVAGDNAVPVVDDDVQTGAFVASDLDLATCRSFDGIANASVNIHTDRATRHMPMHVARHCALHWQSASRLQHFGHKGCFLRTLRPPSGLTEHTPDTLNGYREIGKAPGRERVGKT